MIEQEKSYLVLPQYHAGQLTPDELEQLATLARKYHVPQIKVTGAQRIAFLGTEPRDLEALKEELHLPEAPPHARHRLHYVQACPGSTWCPYGQGNSLAMGDKLRALEMDGPLPYKVKVGVSGCRFCCCESMVRDVGLVGERKGWRLSFGGNGAGRPRVGDVIADGLSDDEALSLVKKTLDVYRKESLPKRRSARFMERFGIEALRKALGLE